MKNTDKRSIESKVEKLEQSANPDKLMVTVIHENGEDGVYIIPSKDNNRLSKEEFKRWRKTLGKNTQILMVRMWGPEVDPATGQGVITIKTEYLADKET